MISICELPASIEHLYADLETSSGNPSIASTDPWDREHCTIIGMAFAFDDSEIFWMTRTEMIESKGWLQELFRRSTFWVNHNVKYDAHVLNNDLGIEYKGYLVDTLTLAKLVDSERQYKGGYSLSALSAGWLNEDITPFEKSFSEYLRRTKDYGSIPLNLLVPYAKQDIRTVRKLYHYINHTMPEMSKGLANTEIKVTTALFQIEKRGLCLDKLMLMRKLGETCKKIADIEEAIAEKHGEGYELSKSAHIEDLILNHCGFPRNKCVYTDKGNISFNKAAIAKYLEVPDAPKDTLAMIYEYKKLKTLNGLFWVAWINKLPNTDVVVDYLHSDYNQSVRSGRLSCRNPNAQQMNDEAKEVIVPREGYSLLAIDYSQIEYRLIIHYIKNEAGIEAYRKDPDVDFHRWVAEMCGIDRKPAKTMNFLMAYGGGRKRAVATLTALSEAPTAEAIATASATYREYHRALPELRTRSQFAAKLVQFRGFVRTAYGRQFHLPFKFARLAFNRVIQGTAADIAKERLVAVQEFLQSGNYDTHLVAMVHDEFLLEVPIGREEEMLGLIKPIMEDTAVSFSVPIRAEGGWSMTNWKECK